VKGFGIVRVSLVLVMIFLSGAANAEVPRTFIDGVEHYRDEKYGDAAEAFQKVADSGVSNGALYYNLGNAYLKAGDVGRAVLWYERASELTPGDPDLVFNLNYARSLVVDEPGDGGVEVARILFFWNHLLSRQAVIQAALTASVVFWLLVWIRSLKPVRVLRLFVYPTALAALIFSATAFYNYYERAYNPAAIVLAQELPVRSGLSDQATELFALHAGSRVRVEKRRNGFVRITFAEGKIGWVKEIGLERI
jgi:tetratricopeptide (TPR) repeat protein